MAYDPSKPADLTPIDAGEMRGQLTGLFDLIQAVPAGPPGQPGPPGPGTVVSVTGGVVDNSDPDNPVILTDQPGGTPQLVFGGGITPGATNYFSGVDVSLSSNPGAAAAVIDGDADNTGFEVGLAGVETSFVFDLMTPRAISALRFRTGSNGGSNTERALDLQFSDNATDWTSNPGPNLPLFGGNQSIDRLFANVGPHRYWRLLWSGGGSTWFGEIEGYADRTGVVPLSEIPSEIAHKTDLAAALAALPPIPLADSGWGDPASPGNKTVVLADYAGGGALAGVDASADAQIAALTAIVQAMQTALRNNGIFLPPPPP